MDLRDIEKENYTTNHWFILSKWRIQTGEL